jgi:hypothetical protein
MPNKLIIFTVSSFCLLVSLLVSQVQVNAQSNVKVDMSAEIRKFMMEKMRRTGGAAWRPTEWQKTLPPIRVRQKGKIHEHTFSDLIKADGYLCPGSARAYKALQVGLPLLYENTVPVLGDFTISYGASICAAMVYTFFMQDFAIKEYLNIDPAIKGKSITLSRISTGEKVTISFQPTEKRGHNPPSAQAGDVILHASNGVGMTVHVER